MKICHMEAMKIVKELEQQKINLISDEDTRCAVSYKEGEEKVAMKYNYDETRAKIKEIDDKVRLIKSRLAKSNCSVIVDGFDVTIGEALVLLAQMQNEIQQLEYLAEKEQLTRRITYNGVVEYTECNYDVEKVKAELQAMRTKVGKLQVAIDRANLVTEIDV